MKWSLNLLPLGLLTSFTFAAPVAERQLDLYQFQISCPANKNVDGRFLSISNATLGVFDEATVDPVRVYATESERNGCSELHTYPVGIVDHSIGLVGQPSLLTLVDMVNPREAEPNVGDVTLFNTFRLTDGKLTNDIEGQWMAFPGSGNSWKVKWSDGSAVITADFMMVDILYKSAGEGRYNGD